MNDEGAEALACRNRYEVCKTSCIARMIHLERRHILVVFSFDLDGNTGWYEGGLTTRVVMFPSNKNFGNG